jgi:putative endopeptidase
MAASLIGDILPDQISELYAKQYYTKEMDEQLRQMYNDIIDGYRQLIREADWLTEGTREGLLRKLESMYFVVGAGAPHEIDAEDAKLIGEDAFCTYVNIAKWNIQKELEDIGQKIDKTESVMPSQIVNSAYSPCNTFTITVAIMHAPYFDVNADYASNLGGLGMVMAHEIGHAFDTNCIAYDENGEYRPDWICEEDQAKLSQRLTQIENYYSGYTIMEIYHVDGVKTSGENYADKGAMECLMKIVQSPDEREQLFENYAYIWCELVEDSFAIRQLQEDVHSPSETRVNAVLSSTDEFYEVYDVTPEDGMYVAPNDRISRW